MSAETREQRDARLVQEAALLTLRATSTRELLTKAYRLTHQMHAEHGCAEHKRRPDLCELRAMRKLIDDEIVRRSKS